MLKSKSPISCKSISGKHVLTRLLALYFVSVLAACGGGSNSATSTDGVHTADDTGSATDGSATDGSTTDGSATDGSATDGSATVGPPPQPDPIPIVRAPPDSQALVGENLPLTPSVTFSGQPLDIPVIQWQKLSGPGEALFSDANAISTSVTFDQAGGYVLEISVSNGPHTGADSLQVTVTDVVVNQAPMVDVGSDELLFINETLNLVAQVTDDGLPDNSTTGHWSMVSGPGIITFGETSALETTATFNAVGDYVLQFDVSDGELSARDALSVEVISVPTTGGNNVNANSDWESVTTANGSKPQPRHESAAVAYENKLYLIGGRGNRQVNRYSPATNQWENLGTPNFELSHFQPVVYDNKIYVVGALDCCYPSESVIANIQIFNPATKQWSTGATMPVNRRRGSAGVVVHNNKIYIVGGSTNGHDGGMVDWFDEYNPANNTWKTLPDAPSKRDHFSAAMVGNKLVAAGGRETDFPNTFQNLVSTVDVYDFSTGQWTAGAVIPTKGAGAMTVSQGEEVILIGGEIDQGLTTLKKVQAYNVTTNTWRQLKPVITGRHSGGAAIVGNAIHVVSGNLTTGGGAETDVHEKLNID